MEISREERRPKNISRLATRALLFNDFLRRGIRTEEELLFFISEFLGFMIPSHTICSHHRSPAEALTDIFFERKDSTFLFGSRSSGKTRLLSILNNCVTADTKIQCPRDYSKYPDGIPIRELIGKEFWVYSYDIPNSKIVLGWAKDVGLRRKQAPVYKVSYSWKGFKGRIYSDSIRVTEDHEFLLFDETYKAAKDLKPGDSLMAFKEFKGSDGYVHVGSSNLNRSGITTPPPQRANRFIWEQVTGIKLEDKIHVHHKDGNPLNNVIDNLISLTNSRHQFHHWNILRDQPSLDKVKKRDSVFSMLGVNPFWFDENWLRDQYLVQNKSCNQIGKEFGTSCRTITNWLRTHKIPIRSPRDQTILSNEQKKDNHKVISVEFDGYEDVFCMEVENTHNFMTSHICIKNCEATFKPGIQICVEGDTPIDCLRDTKEYPDGIPIRELIGKEFWVYSYSTDRRKVELQRGHSVHSQGEKKCVRIDYIWNKGRCSDFIIVDKHHKILMRDGTTYKAAGDLKPGDSLMPITREWDRHGYPYRYAPGVGRVFEHKFAVSEILKRKVLQNEVIHHQSFNPGNTHIEQLEVMTRSDHQKLHARNSNYSSKVFKKFWASMTTFERQEFSRRRVKIRTANYPNNIKLQLYYKKFKTEWWRDLDPAARKKLTDANTKNLPRMYGSENPAFRKDISRNDILHALLFCQGVVADMRKFLNAADNGFIFRRFQQYGWDIKIIRKLFPLKGHGKYEKINADSFESLRNHLDSSKTTKSNHTVVKVSNSGAHEVFSMTVDNTHNYAAKGLFHKNCNAGAIRVQAQRNYEYTLSYYDDDLLASTLKNSIQSHTELNNGSVISVISGSLRGFNGAHPQKLRLDEIELIDWYNIQEAFSMTQASGKWRAQDTLSSTRKFSFGSVQRLLDEAKERHIEVYPWCIWESLEKCTRECKDDPVYGDCPVYSTLDVKTQKERMICGGKAHTCQGWYSIDDFIKKVKLLDRQTWESQWLCSKIGDSAAVYGEFFNSDVHVKNTEKEFFETFKRLEGVELTPHFFRVSGMDFGGNFAFVRLVKSPSNRRRFYILDVYFTKKDVTINDHVKEIKKRLWWGKGREVIFGDPAQRQDIIEFNSRGILVRQALKEVFNGIDLVKSLLENLDDDEPGLIINGVRCEPLVTEFGSYSHKVGKDGKPDPDSIYKAFDHCLDALRYALFTYLKGGGRVRTRNIRV